MKDIMKGAMISISSMEEAVLETAFVEKPDDDIIICRCEEITRGEVRKAIYDGMVTMNEIRRYLRAGMGLCQGQTCSRLVQGILAAELKLKPEDVEMPLSRAPARPVPMAVYALEYAYECEEKEGDV